MFDTVPLLDLTPDAYPHLFERVAIEATNTLKSAEVGIRALKNRSFLRRIYEGIGPDGQIRTAATFDQLRRANVATVEMVGTLMKEELRTRVCVQRVTNNLLDVNRDLDTLIQRSGSLESEVRRQREELIALIRDETRKLAEGMRHLEVEFHRHKVAGWLQTRFQHGDLYPGVGPLMAGALYLTGVAWLHNCTNDLGQELHNAELIVRSTLPQKAISTEEIVLQAAQEIQEGMLEPMDFLASTVPGPGVKVVQRLIQRRRTLLVVNEDVVRDELALVRTLADPEGRLEKGIVMPEKFIRMMAQDLCADLEGGSYV